MTINLINYALAKKDWNKAYEDLKVLEIGGRNLLRDTALTHEGLGAWAGLPEVKWDDEYPYVEMNYGWGISQIIPKLNAGTYTISVLAKEGTNPKSRVRFAIPNNSNLIDTTPLTNKWQRFSATFTVTEDIENWRVYFLNADASEGNAKIKFTRFKLEKGNKATDWTPAPEDINAHPFVAELAETVYRSKQNEEKIRNLENALTALGGGS